MKWVRFVLIPVLILLALMYGCDGKYLYDISSDLARVRSDLHRKSLPIGGHLHMVYDENTHTAPDPTLVFLHGFSTQKEIWFPFARYFHRDYHIVIPDLVGDGESSQPMELDYSIEAQVRRLHRFLSRLKIEHPILVGSSLGGTIALTYAAHYPTEGLVLIDPLGLETEPSYLQKLGVQEAKELFLGICDPRQMERLIDTIYEDPPYIPGVLLDYMTRQKCRLSILDIRKAKGIYRPDGGWIFSDLLPDYAQAIKAPTLILWGDQDKIAHPKNAEAFHRIIPHSRFQYIRKAGHVPAMEYPQKSAKVVWDFLKDLEGKP